MRVPFSEISTERFATRCQFAPLVFSILTLIACQTPPPADNSVDTGEAGSPAVTPIALPEGAEAAATTITAEGLRTDVAELSSDELEGRAPGSPGDEMAQKYIAKRLDEAGVEPGGSDGSWFQPFDIVGIHSTAPPAWSFEAVGESLNVAWWDEYIAGSGVQETRSSIENAEVVFVGYGIQAPEYDWDDFAGVDLAGKVLLMLNNDPDWDPDLFEGNRRLYYGRWDYKYESAARQGAVGAIIIHTTPSAGYPYKVVQTSWTGWQFELPAGDEPRSQVEAWLTWDAAERLCALAGQDLNALVESAKSRDFAPVPLGVTTSLELENEIKTDARTANVAGLLRGSDPELSDEVVVYTAHFDHLGRGQANDEGDDIYNGARDNAAGVAQIIAIAEAMTQLPSPPRRSVLFLLVAAEEQGLLGSKFYAENPTFPAGKIAANVNFDAGNIFGPTKDLVNIGYGKSDLDRVIEQVAATQGRVVVGDRYPNQGSFYRSDQFSFAKIGVPALYLDSGNDYRNDPDGAIRRLSEEWVEIHYHQQSDELDDSWNFEGLIEDTQAGLLAGLAIANSDAFPAWTPGDEFEATRQAAVAALNE